MTKKKRNHPDADEILSRPWCYYCERDFDDLKILINHQKAKHFKCERCGRRLNTAGGLSVHMSQVHKENLTAVDNALPNRAGLDIEIFGMEGIPEEIVQQHHQRVLTNFHQAQVDRQTATGNPAPGGNNALKKPKLEATSDLKKRLAEHKAAKLAAEQGEGRSSGGSTPQPAAPGHVAGSNGFSTVTSYSQYQQPYTAPPANGSYIQAPAYSPAAPPPVFNQQPVYSSAASPPQPGYAQSPVNASYPQHQPYAQPPQALFQQQVPPSYPPPNAFSPPPYQTHSPYPGQSYSPNAPNAFPGQPTIPPRPFGAGSPVPPFQQQHASPVTPNNFPQPIRSGSVSLSTASGLPQRPAVGAPPVSGFQFQQMHQGQIPAPQTHAMHAQYQKQDVSSTTSSQPHVNGAAQNSVSEPPNAASIDDLISSASKQADANAAASQIPSQAAPTHEGSSHEPTPAAVPSATTREDAADEKGAKKDKDKPKTTRLVYSDNDTSPEEKMAMLVKYAFTVEQTSIMA